MDTKKLIMSSLAGGVTLFLLGFAFYAVLLHDFFNAAAGASASVYRQEPILVAVFLGELSLAVLISYIFGNWANISTFATGAKGGAIVGLLIGLGIGLVYYGVTTLGTLTSTLVDAGITVIRVSIAGGVVGWVLGR